MTVIVEKPVGTLADIVAFEQVPWQERLSVPSIYHLLKAAADEHPTRQALTFLHTGDLEEEPIRFTFAQAMGQITGAANLFHDLGVGKDDVVSILMPNQPQAVFALWGATAAGIANPINYLLSADQIASLLATARSKVLVVLGQHPVLDTWQKVSAIRHRLPELKWILRVGSGEQSQGVLDFDTALAGMETRHLQSTRSFSREQPAIYFHTGGTTGSPKMAARTHGNDIYCAWAACQWWHYTPTAVMFNVLPLFHVAGAIISCLAPMAAASETVFISPFGLRQPTALANHWRLVEKYQATHVGGVPTNLVALMDVPVGDADISSIHYSLTGGSPLPLEIATRWREAFQFPFSQIYGMTEAGSAIAASPFPAPAPAGSVGLRSPYTHWHCVDPNHPETPLKAGERGVVVVSGPGTFSGYLDSSHDKGTLLTGGQVLTGDLGYVDEQGFLFLLGRVKDLIIRGGHNIDPAIIEEALSNHPAVALAAAVARPDAYAGELPVVYVQLNQGHKETAEELLTFLEQHISERPALPKELFILELMPLTAVGKIFKPALRQMETERVLKGLLSPLADAETTIEIKVMNEQTTINVIAPAARWENLSEQIKRIVGLLPIIFEIKCGLLNEGEGSI